MFYWYTEVIQNEIGHYFYNPAEAPDDQVVYEWFYMKLLNSRKFWEERKKQRKGGGIYYLIGKFFYKIF